MRRASIVLALLGWSVVPAHSESGPVAGKALAAPLQFLHQFNQENLIAASKRMPEEKFGYRPAPAPVRSFRRDPGQRRRRELPVSARPPRGSPTRSTRT